jgi:hypothetical protein
MQARHGLTALQPSSREWEEEDLAYGTATEYTTGCE